MEKRLLGSTAGLTPTLTIERRGVTTLRGAGRWGEARSEEAGLRLSR